MVAAGFCGGWRWGVIVLYREETKWLPPVFPDRRAGAACFYVPGADDAGPDRPRPPARHGRHPRELRRRRGADLAALGRRARARRGRGHEGGPRPLENG